jgi:mono/diheme cytochrome c family protein
MERSIRDVRPSAKRDDRRRALLLALLPVALLLLPIPATGQEKKAAKVSTQEYDGWRQYSVHCARCHGQDVVGNPVAADLLKSAGPGGPAESQKVFVDVVQNGRTAGGMPAFGKTLTPAQAAAIYAYVKARADKRIPAGRPAPPA